MLVHCGTETNLPVSNAVGCESTGEETYSVGRVLASGKVSSVAQVNFERGGYAGRPVRTYPDFEPGARLGNLAALVKMADLAGGTLVRATLLQFSGVTFRGGSSGW